MNTEMIKLMDTNNFNESDVRTAYKELKDIQGHEYMGMFKQRVNERIDAFNEQNKKNYTQDALKDGLRAIITEEQQSIQKEMNATDEKMRQKRDYIKDKALKAINKTEDISADEITKRMYHANEMANKINLELGMKPSLSETIALLTKLSNEAEHDQIKARALYSNLSAFQNHLNNSDDPDKRLAILHFNSLAKEIEGRNYPKDVQVYKALLNEMDTVYSMNDVTSASALSINMQIDTLNKKYGL